MASSNPRTNRLVLKLSLAALVAIATYLVGVPLVARLRSKPAVPPIDLRTSKELPAWKPGPGWLTARAQPGTNGRVSLPFYPPFTDEQSAALFVRTRGEVFDPLCGDIWQPNVDSKIPFAEYPGGAFAVKTNSFGMREDTEPAAQRPAVRILVTGDSHTDGVCANAESYSNLLEGLLRDRAASEAKLRGEQLDPASIEVLNTGKGAYSFYNYLGVLERFVDLAPAVFIVGVYGGNDFEEALSVWHFYFNAGKRPRGMPVYAEEVKAASAINKGAVAQGLASVRYFSTYPEQLEIANRAASEVLDNMQALCLERGIRLIVVYIPSWMEVAPDDPALRLDEMLTALGLTRADLESTTRMADAMLAHLAQRGVESLDLRSSFAAATEPLYWKLDCHLGLSGNRLVARELAPLFARQ
ncbi:MAG TPA: SGNH/GDSL hydrolase family protein [Planctomycetota bacterium]|nr:SGNH/GDSL hydrolase family protein [Planctomycetota bacterium]